MIIDLKNLNEIKLLAEQLDCDYNWLKIELAKYQAYKTHDLKTDNDGPQQLFKRIRALGKEQGL